MAGMASEGFERKDSRNGGLVSIEGIDGSGKTSVVERLAEENEGIETTAEPSTLWTGGQVRRALATSTEDVHDIVTFFLFMADRKQHIEEEVLPWMHEGKVVVSDRYVDSTRAYQPEMLKEHIEWADAWIDMVMEPWTLEPDLTIFLDVSVDTAMDRLSGDETFEERETLEAVRDRYWDIIEDATMRQSGRHIAVVDGEAGHADVMAQVRDVLREKRFIEGSEKGSGR